MPSVLILQIDENTAGTPVNVTYLDAAPDISVQGTPIAIRRGVTDASGVYKPFDDFKEGDADISSIGGQGSYSFVRMVVYAFSYGKRDLSTELYSSAIYVEYIDFTSLEIAPP